MSKMDMKKPMVALLLTRMVQDRIMAGEDLPRLKKAAVIKTANADILTPEICRKVIKGADAVITSWHTPRLTEEILRHAPSLKLIAHAAGTVKPVVSDDVWLRKIRVTSTASAITISVAQFTLGMMLTQSVRPKKFADDIAAHGGWGKIEDKLFRKGLHNITIGLLGGGFVGRKVIEYLKMFEVKILLFDPTLSRKAVAELGAQKAGLAQLAEQSDIVSSHAPSIPATDRLINKWFFDRMKPDALLINTSRGSVIDEKAMIAWLKKNKTAFACLDVTAPEPPAAGSPLRVMANVLLTPHIAGLGANTRQGKYAVADVLRLFAGQKPLYEVTEKMLGTMA